MIVCFRSPITVNPQCAVGGWLAVVWPKHRGGKGRLLYFVTAAEFACFHNFCSHLSTNPVRYTSSQWAGLLYCFHACMSQLVVVFSRQCFPTMYNLSCSQWLEWCRGIFIVIANVSLSSFQPMTPPDKLFKDKSLKTHFYLFLVSLQKRYFWVVYFYFFYFLVSLIEVHFWTPYKGKHDCF